MRDERRGRKASDDLFRAGVAPGHPTQIRPYASFDLRNRHYELVFKKSVAKDLRRLPKEDVRRIVERMRMLADDPRPAGCEKLSGLERYRVRQGLYRIVYEVQDRRLIVLAVKVGHRRDVYPMS